MFHRIPRLLAKGACLLVMALGNAEAGAGAQDVTAARGVFRETACDLPQATGEMLARLRCGVVGVPRDYAAPDAGRFDLAVVVGRSGEQPARPDPVVYISGGPGSPLTIYAAFQARHPYAAGRDLILVDQRGMGRSQPEICPDHRAALLEGVLAMAMDASDAARARRRTTITACRDEAVARGLDLRDFGTAVTVQDFEAVRRSLGVQRWNVVGESYGTTVAMMLMAQHPDPIRSAVLDSLYPPDEDMPRWSTRVADARTAFFASCDRDPACASFYPNLAGTYRAAVQRLETAPLVVTVPSRGNARVPVSAALFEIVVGRALYYPTAYAGLPHLIASVRDGRERALGAAFDSVIEGAETGNLAANAAVECRDRPIYRGRDLADLRSDPLDRIGLYGLCAGWSEIGPPLEIPRDTGIPTLVLAGQFDPNLEPDLSRHVSDIIGPRVAWIAFAGIGHSVRHFSPCADAVVAAFIEHPAPAPDAACASVPGSVAFVPPDAP